MGSGVLQETVSCCIHKLSFKLNQYRYRKKKNSKHINKIQILSGEVLGLIQDGYCVNDKLFCGSDQ